MQSRLVNLDYGFIFRHQQGSVLVVVLLILVLLATASLIALRSSKASLDLTTSYQINQLLFQASDAALLKIANSLQDSQQLSSLTAEQGPIGYLLVNDQEHAFAEYTLCYLPQSGNTLYSTSHAPKIITGSGQVINGSGYCKIASSQSNYFNSERKIIATQLSFIRLNPASVENTNLTSQIGIGNMTESKSQGHTQAPFSGILGEDVGSAVQTRIRIYATSVMPTFSQEGMNEVDACLAKPVARVSANETTIELAENQMTCLERTGTPFNIQVADYVYTLTTRPISTVPII